MLGIFADVPWCVAVDVVDCECRCAWMCVCECVSVCECVWVCMYVCA